MVLREGAMLEYGHTSMMMVALVGPAHKVMWRQHDWGNWFLKAKQHFGHCQFHIDEEVEMVVCTQLQVQKGSFYHSMILDSC